MTQSELGSEIPPRRTQLVRLRLERQTEAEQTLHGTPLKELPASGKRDSPVRVSHETPFAVRVIAEHLRTGNSENARLVATFIPAQRGC